jgi:hypothetical protein
MQTGSLILRLYESKVKQWFPEGVPWGSAQSDLNLHEISLS